MNTSTAPYFPSSNGPGYALTMRVNGELFTVTLDAAKLATMARKALSSKSRKAVAAHRGIVVKVGNP